MVLTFCCNLLSFRLEANLPETFQSNSIRVFSRYKEKDDLLAHVFRTWVENRDVVATAGPPEVCLPQQDEEPVLLSQEEDDFDAYNHSEGGIFDNGLRNGDDDDDASVDFNRGAPEQEDDDHLYYGEDVVDLNDDMMMMINMPAPVMV